MNSVISGLTRQKFTIFLHVVATSPPLLMRAFKRDIATRFRAIVQRMQVVSIGVHEILPKSIDCHGNVPRHIGKRDRGLSSAPKALS